MNELGPLPKARLAEGDNGDSMLLYDTYESQRVLM